LFFETPVDPAVYSSGEINKINLILTRVYGSILADYFIGLAAQQIIPQKVGIPDKSVSLQKGELVPQLFGTPV